MTAQDVRERVTAIRAAAGVLTPSDYDNEAAHALEDDLYRDLIRAIEDGSCTYPRECAAIALETQALDFTRHCA